MAKLKDEGKKLLADVPDEYVFRSQDGSILRNMEQLGSALESMAEETYTFHVNAEKNDFANWVRDIIKDEKLAKDLLKATDKTQAAKVVTRRISTLSKK